MSSRFVHAHGRGGPADAAGQPRLRRGAPGATPGCSTARSQMRWGDRRGGAAGDGWRRGRSTRSRASELAPVEDQSHISLFMRGLARRVAGGDQPRLARGGRTDRRRSPRPKFMWSLTGQLGRVRRHGGQGLEASGRAPPSRCTARCSARSRRCPGCGSSPGSTRRCPRRASTTSSWSSQSDAPPEQMLRDGRARWSAPGWQSGKFLYVDTDLKIDLPEARVVIDREQVADLGLDLASVGQELGTLLGGGVRQPVQLLRPQLQGDPPDRRRRTGPRSVRCSTSRSRRRAAQLVPVSTFTHIETEHRAADAEPVPAAQRGPGLRRREAGRHQGGGAARPGERRGARPAARA